MIIIPIFVLDNDGKEPFEGLYSVHYESQDQCEFDRLFQEWNNPEYLDVFFEANQADLQGGYFGNITIGEAILKTIEEATEFEDALLDMGDKGMNLGAVFKPLNNFEYRIVGLQKSKGRIRNGWLRLYAIRLTENCFIITGGAIKLTQHMRPAHLQYELQQLNKVRDFLQVNGIDYPEDLNSINNE